MTIEELKQRVGSGEVDTVIVAVPDVYGRLMGKRFTASHFLNAVADGGTHGCNYLLTVNIEMDPLDDFRVANWASGFGDFEMRPDASTLRVLPWQEGTALVLADFLRHDGTLVAEAPRSVLRAQLDRLKAEGRHAYLASELEFFLYRTSYPAAFASDYRDLKPSSDYRIDYHTMQTARDEPFLRKIRNDMTAAGIAIESTKGEWGCGQHEVNFVYREALPMADGHVVFKQGVKEIAAQQDLAVSFMPKVRTDEAGNSCHIHLSLWGEGRNLFWDEAAHGGSKLFRGFLGGLMKYAPELCCFTAPTINAYKRYQFASWAPTKMAWAWDNRTVGFRVVGHGPSFRVENRMPGADANPYLAFAAMLAAGLAGVEEGLDCGGPYEGNAYTDDRLPALPATLREAAELLHGSRMARAAFGDEVVDYYVHTARLEDRAFREAVTDWERRRYFERI